ncbi:MAG: hypothetical protein LBB61_01905 [Treponema sp.]|jgi:hypothetical protein|nr:hypothetical protein [Treponema sp.]
MEEKMTGNATDAGGEWAEEILKKSKPNNGRLLMSPAGRMLSGIQTAAARRLIKGTLFANPPVLCRNYSDGSVLYNEKTAALTYVRPLTE